MMEKGKEGIRGMAKEMDTQLLNQRLEFCGRTREELAAAIAARGVHCSVEAIRQAMTKEDRPIHAVIRSECAVVTARWVKERREALTAEVGRQMEALGVSAEGLEVLAPDSRTVVVLQDGTYIGSYDPDTRKLKI